MNKQPCKGFTWIGQSFKSCDRCGQPYWEHIYNERIKRDASPFDDDAYEYVLISDEDKVKTKAHWSKA